jgi:predicted GIY-YIG superfamily endonuclease
VLGLACAPIGDVADKRFVYMLRSESKPDEPYVGCTSDVKNRLKWHNDGPDGYTRKYRPWRLVVSIEFGDEATAVRFERYLKSGSGGAFAKRHFSPKSGV